MTTHRRTRRLVALALVSLLAVAAAACGGDADEDAAPDGVDVGDPGDCTIVDVVVSPEKIDLMTELARTFNADDVEVDGRCVFAQPAKQSSGAAMQALIDGWDEAAFGPRPVIWSPAGSTWGSVLNQRLADRGDEPMTSAAKPFMLTPLVIAMPRPMAEALGWPDTDIGWQDILTLATDPEGWAAKGHPEWGPFRLGKTNPNFSTSGLNALVAQAYAATGKTDGLTVEDLEDPETDAFARGVESAVVHYGDTTLTFLNNWYQADRRGTPFTYASAAAVEEKSVIDYNAGNPDGILDPGEQPRPPRVPLVAVYPEEGTLFSDNPFYVLRAEWADDTERSGAEAFIRFIQQPENQRKVLQYGFRPGNPDVAIGKPIVSSNGVDPKQPQTLLEVPAPKVMVGLLDKWATQRKGARVLLLVDVSGSMGSEADPDTGETKLDLAKRASVDSLDEFKRDDLVGLRIFTTDFTGTESPNWQDLVPIEPFGPNREGMRTAIEGLYPSNATPLYDATHGAVAEMLEDYDPARINAVVLLSDGVNDDGDESDDQRQLAELLDMLRRRTQGESATPVRVFAIAYGSDADTDALRQIAEASSAKMYDATDPSSITKVLTQVISNF